MQKIIYKDSGEIFEADACGSLDEAVSHNKVKMNALVNGHYPGTPLPPGEVDAIRSIGYWDAQRDQDWGLGWHRNEGIEITYLAKGTLDLAVGGKNYHLRPGDFTLTRPWQRHRVGLPNVNASQLFWVIFDFGVRFPHSKWQWPSWFLFSKEVLFSYRRFLFWEPSPRVVPTKFHSIFHV